MKKILVRIVGALCILGAAALMFLPTWFTVEDMNRKEFRKVRNDACGMIDRVEDIFVECIEDDDFKDTLSDSGLPAVRSKLKSRFKEIKSLCNELLNNEVSLKEITQTSFMVPGLLEDIENLAYADSDVSNTFFYNAAAYAVYEGSDPYPDADGSYVLELSENMRDSAVEVVDALSGVSFLFVVLGCIFAGILLLAVISAVTHVCNKGRWVKYLFLAVLVILVAGSCVAMSMVSPMLADMGPIFKDASLRMGITPFLAVAVMFIPIVLDIIYERKS